MSIECEYLCAVKFVCAAMLVFAALHLGIYAWRKWRTK